MASREELLQQRQEDLSLVVEPLVDSISELVLSSVTGAFENVQSCCMDIAERTNKLVLIAQQVATSSTDVDLQMEVANSINDVALSIEKLVTTFNDILTSSNSTTQSAFAGAAKYVGEAINRLCAATDETSQQKIMGAVKEAIESAKQVQQAAFLGKDKLVSAAQVNVDKTVRLVKVASLAAGSTADEKKKGLLLDGSNRVKSGGPALIQAAKSVVDRPNDPSAKSDLDARAQYLTDAFTMLINAAKLSPSYFGKLNDTFDYIKRLIDRAKEMEDAASNLYNVTISGTADQFVAAAKLAANKALLLCEEAESLARKEKDPVKRVLIRDAAAELREASADMIRAAKAYRENPNDPARKANLQRAHERLEAAIRRVLETNSADVNDQTPKGKLATTANALEIAAKNVVYSARNNPADLIEDAQTLAAIALQYVKDAEVLAAATADPAERKRILDDAQAIKNASQALIAAAKKLAQNPNDPQAQKELEEAHRRLLDLLNQARRNAKIIPGGEQVQETKIDMSASGKSAEAQLVAAAKEEAAAALQLADEADKLADRITDPSKKAALKRAIQDVRAASKKVVECAELVAANPHDSAAQEKLSQAQKELAVAIEKVVGLTSGATDREVNDAMADMKDFAAGGLEGNLLEAAQQLLDKIAATFGDPNRKMSPQEVINSAKELSTNAAELAKQLRDMAAKTTDPVYREKLLTAAKIIRDGGIQIKILSAVRAAGGEDKGNSVAMAAKGLQTNIQDIIKEVRAEALRNKFRNTVKQTIAINKVVSVWRKKATK